MTVGELHHKSDDGESNPSSGDVNKPKRAQRARALKAAKAAFNNEFSAIPCTLRDVSDSGAHLQFEGGWFIPDRFTLHVDIDGYKIECERVWHRGSECGVRFVGEKIATGKERRQVISQEPLSETANQEELAPSQTHVEASFKPRPPQAGKRTGFGRRTR